MAESAEQALLQAGEATVDVAVAIASGQALSAAIDLGPYGGGARVELPAAWTAANLTFQVSRDNATFAELNGDDGTAYTVVTGGYTAATGGVVATFALNPTKFLGVRYLKVRSGTAGAPVVQGGARTLYLSARATQ